MKVEKEEPKVTRITITLEGEEIEFMHALAHCSSAELERIIKGELVDQGIGFGLLDNFRANLNIELMYACPRLETPGGGRG